MRVGLRAAVMAGVLLAGAAAPGHAQPAEVGPELEGLADIELEARTRFLE
jgi:hypothetical protein